MKGKYLTIRIGLNPAAKEKLDKIPWGLKSKLLSYIIESTLEKHSIEELINEMLTLPNKPSRESKQEPEQKSYNTKAQRKESEEQKLEKESIKQVESKSKKSKEDEFFEKIEKTFEDWL